MEIQIAEIVAITKINFQNRGWHFENMRSLNLGFAKDSRPDIDLSTLYEK